MTEAVRKIKPPGMFFLDSGAFGLYVRKVKKRGDYSFFRTKEFRTYVDEYAEFVMKHIGGIDFYANVDVLDNPKLSWRVLKYLEQKYGLSPVPVIHPGTDLEWVERHVEAGYKFIGLGGGGRGRSKASYKVWADGVFRYLCPKSNDYKPIVRIHGFALTAYDLMIRYPWWSVDSTSWVQSAAWGGIYVPHKRKGKFIFTEAPYSVMISSDSPSAKEGDSKHYLKFSKAERGLILEWLEKIDVALGSTDEWGVVSEHNARKIANLKFYQAMLDSMPPWPQPFRPGVIKEALI